MSMTDQDHDLTPEERALLAFGEGARQMAAAARTYLVLWDELQLARTATVSQRRRSGALERLRPALDPLPLVQEPLVAPGAKRPASGRRPKTTLRLATLGSP